MALFSCPSFLSWILLNLMHNYVRYSASVKVKIQPKLIFALLDEVEDLLVAGFNLQV